MTLNPLNRRLRDRVLVCLKEAQRDSPGLFTGGILVAAAAFAVGHYSFGEQMFYPKVALWKERVFWSAFPLVIFFPLAHWVVWTVISLGRLKAAPVILAATATLCLGDLVWLLVWLNFKAVGLDYKRFVDYWDWWAHWMPVVMVTGNLFLARWWWKMFRQAKSQEVRSYTRPERILRSAAVFLGCCAAALTTIHLLLPRMSVNDFTLSMADTFLVQEDWRKDFDFVLRNSVSRGKRLGAILAHAELAHLQRCHFYPDLNESAYQEFVLSPVVDRLPLSELDWRRTLWENFYPRVRNEHDPALAAQTVVRYLRERVGIDPEYGYRVGVETIWIQQMAAEIGFERIYVAALRSVGIAARVNEGQRAELWTGTAWREAPRPIVANWSTHIEKNH